MKNIFIDCGHGGNDSGAVGLIIEKDYVLKLGNKVVEKLKKYPCNVFYSRNTDKYLTLNERVRLSNINNCDVFISIHCNDDDKKQGYGFESFTYSGDSELQKVIHNNLVTTLGTKDRGMKKASFYVLKHTKAKAILLELGFVHNENDCKILNDKLDEIADSIVKSLVTVLDLTPSTEKREVFRVLIGSYTIKENAENMIRQLEKDGYKPSLIKATI